MSYQRDFTERLNVAVVGVGRHAYRNILPTLTFLPVNLRAICDLNLDMATRTAEQYGVDAVYTSTAELYANERLDAVFLCVSQNLHPQLAREAFDHGVHVWMEKPPALRAAQVAEMIESREDRVCVVGFKKAFMPAAFKAREIFSNPTYGPVQNMLGVYPIPRIPDDPETVLSSSKPIGWLKNGCHPLALMLSMGGRVASVTLHRGKLKGAVCVLQFESGCIGNLHLIDGANKTQPVERYTFVGNDCQLDIDNCWRVTFQRGIPFEYERQTSYLDGGTESGAIVWEPQNHLSTLENRAEFTQGIYGEMRHFCDCVLEGKPATHGTLEDALEVMKVYEAALRSQGNSVPLNAGATTTAWSTA